MGDSKSGTIVLCHEEHYLSKKIVDDSEDIRNSSLISEEKSMCKRHIVNKMIVSMVPRVVLIPSISCDSGPLLDFTLVRSPAPNILVSFLILICFNFYYSLC